ncbi:hypothetical protein [Halomonas sp. 11-S5]|uniref:hypothetical protein n=1 Tax=Halomonas sp. 11-S5 TaxID=2994064 RepID=UPI0024686174|nr:hypothetical protein [Halomonas sp. 11-S5]
MTFLEFFASIIGSLAWPVATVVFVVLLKKPVTELVPLLRKLKYKELELEFAEGLNELKPPAEQLQVQGSKGSGSELERLAEVSPRAAIIEAWLQVEAEAARVAASFWTGSNREVFRNYAKLGDYLEQCKVLNSRQAQNFRKLRELRNKAAHYEKLEIDQKAASVYVHAAVELVEHLRAQ